MTQIQNSQGKNSKRNASNSSGESVYNTEIKIPADILKSIEKRQQESIKNGDAIHDYYKNQVFTAEEMIARNRIFERIAKKLGIYDEIKELHELEKIRYLRSLKAFKKVQSNQSLQNLL